MRYLKALPLAAVALALACTDASDPVAPAGRQPLRPSFTNTPVTGAAFTTTNTNQDGTGHCKNGNEDVNCNIYDGKEFVWLNGGPSTAYVGDGSYFFAVLSPGGQPAPNDGGTNTNGELANLSDNFDTYGDRTFSVSGGTVTYSGPHDFFDNKIRLVPYEDTPNPGGVYILAICSLADGYPVTPSKCKYDAFKVREGEETKADAPTILKDAEGSYDNTFTWQITKDVDKTRVEQVGGSVTFNYTITVTHDGGTIGNVKVSGTITVFNPNSDDITGADVTDALSDNTSCTVTGGSNATLTPGDNDFAYECDLGSTVPSETLDNTATVTWPTQTVGAFELTGGSADFTFSGISFDENTIDETVTVTDDQGGTLGTVTVGDDNPKTFEYSRTITVIAGCHDYPNTATFTTNDTGATGSDDVTVTVCGPTRTGALTMGFWKGPNGNSLIQNYCAPTGGKPSLATYLSGLGAGSGPFSDAAGKSCNQLVTYVNNIFKAASATDMNKMLKAQMLATALDVYFSTSTLGYSTTASGKIKPPSSFLPNGGIGTFSMDLTAICPMIDNLSTGTATCKNNTPSTDAVAAGAVPSSPLTVQQILDFAATVPPFNGSTTSSNWYSGNRTKQEILKNIFDQINNQDAFAG